MASELLEVDDSRQGEDKRTIDELMRWPLWGLKSEIKLMYFYLITFKGRSRREQIFIDSKSKTASSAKRNWRIIASATARSLQRCLARRLPTSHCKV
jgi:hypothetical protein